VTRRVLVVHNAYRQRGGEDQVFEAEASLLERHGHDVKRYVVHNDETEHMGAVHLLATTVWNRTQFRGIRSVIRAFRPHVVHVHNTLPLISPAVYGAAHAEAVPVVQSLHNYRLVCPSALLFREGRPCEMCIGRSVPWPGVWHACYRDSRAASAAVATMLVTHRGLGTYARRVHRYIALTPGARARFVAGGLPEAKIVVKPNFIDEPTGPGAGDGGYALFVGRLSEEKGVRELIEAWHNGGGGMRLRVVGDGPLMDLARQASAQLPAIEVLGRVRPADVRTHMRGATILIVPSTCYESFPMTIVEAFASGTPVVASRHGAMAEIVDNGRTGLHFHPGDSADLALKLEWVGNHPAEIKSMRAVARREYEEKYTASRNYALLQDIYAQAIVARRGGEV
jgi:glycosyltransferase involved in cell wall biosynthesis